MGCCSGGAPKPTLGDAPCAAQSRGDERDDCCGESPIDDCCIAPQVKAEPIDDGCQAPKEKIGDCCTGGASAGGGCCGIDEPPSACDDGCCESDGDIAGDIAEDDDKSADPACEDTCCEKVLACASQPTTDVKSNAGDCCGADTSITKTLPESPASPSPCNKGCCGEASSEAPAATDVVKAPDCCGDKPSPCCDESCLDRLALRECAANACVDPADSASCNKVDTDGRKRSACDGHRRSARERYGGTLEAIGCICRALFALGLESCCETQSMASVERKRNLKRRSTSSLSRRSIDSCCPPRTAPKSKPAARAQRMKDPGGCCNTTSANDKCCSSAKEPREKATASRKRVSVDSCCVSEKALPDAAPTANSPSGGSCVTGCCAPKKPNIIDISNDVDGNDVESRSAGSEHVVLCVSGMTCTGCETKLNRTLATVPGVKNLKSSLVLSRAEFDIELRLVTVEEVMKHLERTTEFKCERITNNGSSVEVMVPGDVSAFINKTWPPGIVDMSPVGSGAVKVIFDPKIIGARDLVDKHWDKNIKLAPVRGDLGLEAGGKHVRHIGYMTIASAILTIPVLVLAWAPLPKREIAYSSASLALATIVQVVIAGPFYPKALKALVFSKVIEMDLLIVLSTSAAYIFSVVSFGYLAAKRPLSTGQFFETSTLLVTLIMVGRYVAALARQKAVESISTQSLQPSKALLVDRANPLEEQEIDVRLLQFGDLFKVVPDSRIPTDGTVVEGSSEVDESMLTGESLPVEKYEKSSVIAGTINGSGTLVVRLTRLPGDNTITTIAAMVDEAKLSKPKLQELADKVASYFVPTVVALTLITFVIWVAVGIAVRGKSGSAAAVDAITYAITVLIVSCPCAIGLAVPMVVVIASGVAAERGVIFKSASAIEVAYKASHVVFDKTGTLTQGKLTIATEHYVTNNDKTRALLLGLINDSRHPVSLAVANHLRSQGVDPAVVPGAKSLTGKGLEAVLGGQTLKAGNSRWLQMSSDQAVESVLAQNCTVFCFTIDGKLAAVYGLEDSIRAEAARVVLDLQKRGLSVHVVSGDDYGAVESVAKRLGVSNSNTRARSSPSDKQAYIVNLLNSSPKGRKPTVIFCGDGTNDAIALAQATIGVHMNEGSDVAQSAADVVLMRPDLEGILTIMDASKRSVRRIQFNFGWSFVYNLFAILLAAGAFVNARIPPEFAGLGELVSVLPVIAAAVLLRWS